LRRSPLPRRHRRRHSPLTRAMRPWPPCWDRRRPPLVRPPLVRWLADVPGGPPSGPPHHNPHLLACEIVFAREGELLPGPGRAVLVVGLDDNRGTGGGGPPPLLAGGALVGRRRPQLAASSSPLAASTSLASAALAACPGVVAQRRPPLVTSSSLTSFPSSLQAPTSHALDGHGRCRAVSRRLSAPCLLVRGSVRGLLPQSSARDLRLTYPPILTARGGLRQGDPKLFKIFISSPFFSRFFFADVAKATAPAAPPSPASI
jgi:hypothetical protein